MTLSDTEQKNTDAPVVERVRHELRRRELTVKSADYITPRMLRIEFTGDALGDFISLGADDHIKIFLPTGGEKPEMREYTPRRYDTAAKTLTLDFAIHDAGPATAWALDAKPGDKLEIGGPRGSAVIHGDAIEHWVLIGDETALPAIGRRIEESGKGVKITSIITVTDENEHQSFETEADHNEIWVHRPLSATTDATGIIEVLKTLDIRPRTYFWIASETSVTRAVRAYLTEQAGVPLPWMKAAGYWLKGQADTSDKSM